MFYNVPHLSLSRASSSFQFFPCHAVCKYSSMEIAELEVTDEQQLYNPAEYLAYI